MNTREDFEAVFTSAKAYTNETTGDYLQPYLQAWQAWQAATNAALERSAVERKPMADDDTLDLFNRVQRGMRFTDLQPFSAGVAAAEYFHGIKENKS